MAVSGPRVAEEEITASGWVDRKLPVAPALLIRQEHRPKSAIDKMGAAAHFPALRLLLEKRPSYLHFLVDWLRSFTSGSVPQCQPHAHTQGRSRRDVVVIVGRVPVLFACQVLYVQLKIDGVVHGIEQRGV